VSRARLRLFRLAIAVVAALVPLALFEGIVALGVRSPGFAAWLPRGLLRDVRAAYLNERRSVQYERSSGRFDPDLLYTLSPGRSTFANVEFKTTYDVNSLGVRGPESALDGPELVVTGDSYAMGWGVEEEETFASRLGATLKLKTLDASVSSYGTVREMLLLNRADLRRARLLVVQYCRNDWGENAAFKANGNRHRCGSIDDYRAAIRLDEELRRWWPGKYVLRAVRGRIGDPPPPPPPPEDEADAFLNALFTASRFGIDRLKIVVLDPTNPWMIAGDPAAFTRALEARLELPENAERAKKLRVLDVTKLLEPSDYFLLDDHLRPSGHAKIAKALAELLGS
jgi:hypothetical protein